MSLFWIECDRLNNKFCLRFNWIFVKRIFFSSRFALRLMDQFDTTVLAGEARAHVPKMVALLSVHVTSIISDYY